MTKIPLLIDTDPGIDDAAALMTLLRRCPERVGLVLASYGNVSLAATARNAGTLLSLLQSDCPLAVGAAGPLFNPRYEDAGHIHGADGLAGLPAGLVTPTDPLPGDGLQAARDFLLSVPKADYLALGPLTNLALLLQRYPEVEPHLGQVVCMGGGFDGGNVTPYAEFNLHCDAEAAAYVFARLPRLVLVPIDLTNRIFFDLPAIEAIAACEKPAARAMAAVLREAYRNCLQYGEAGATMHDAAAALCLLHPDRFQCPVRRVRVICTGERYGETAPDADGSPIHVAEETDIGWVLAQIAGAVTA